MFRAPGRVSGSAPTGWWVFRNLRSAGTRPLSALALASLLLTRNLAAQEQVSAAATEPTSRPLEILWSSPPACDQAEQLEAEVRHLLGPATEHADVTVQATLVQLPGGRFRLDLELTGQAVGTRSLEAEQCLEAVRAGAVVLALAINPEALENAPNEPAEPLPVEPSPPPDDVKEPPPAPPQPHPVTPRAIPLMPFAGLHGRLSQGLTPGPRGGAGLALGVQRDWLRLELRGFIDPQQRRTGGLEGPAVFSATGGGLRVCARAIQSKAADLHFCAGMGVAHVHGHAEAFDDSESQRALLLTADAAIPFRWHLTPYLSLLLEGGYVMPTTRPRFVIERVDAPLHVEHQVTGGPLASLGLEVRFNVGQTGAEAPRNEAATRRGQAPTPSID